MASLLEQTKVFFGVFFEIYPPILFPIFFSPILFLLLWNSHVLPLDSVPQITELVVNFFSLYG